MRARAAFRSALLAGIALAATALHAHDSWLVHDGAKITIVTGTRYPRAELEPPQGSIAHAACSDAGAARGCWTELREFDIVLPPRIVDVYLREVQPPDAVRARWSALHADGVDWRERYRKFARIEFTDANTTPEQLQAIRRPANLDLEILPDGDAALRTGARASFVVLSKGEPVRNLAVELVSERNPLGLWARTDDQGRVSWPLPFSGGWLVRTVLIEPDGAQGWRSRFATFAFDAN